MSVWLNKCVWLVWMRSGVRIQTFASLDTCVRSISFSALVSPWRMPVMGISGARLDSTADGEIPTAVAACVKAAIAPRPMPARNNVQNTFPLKGRRARWIPFTAAP